MDSSKMGSVKIARNAFLIAAPAKLLKPIARYAGGIEREKIAYARNQLLMMGIRSFVKNACRTV
jgi:hypothetical protein